jgi:hypothetical protein
MSIVQNPIVGRSSGKFSNAIFSKWKDKNTLRSKALVVNQPNTADQLTQRSVFAASVRYARMVLSLIRFTLKTVAVSMSEFNYYMKMNTRLVDPITYAYTPVNVPSLRFALGAFTALVNVAITSATASAVALSWSVAVTPPDYEADMQVSFVIFNATMDELFFFKDVADFVTGTASLPVDFTSNDNIYVFAFVGNQTGTKFSSSQYVGQETVAW